MFKKIVSFLAVPALMAVSGATFAAEGAASSGVDLSPLTNSIDFSTVLGFTGNTLCRCRWRSLGIAYR